MNLSQRFAKLLFSKTSQSMLVTRDRETACHVGLHCMSRGIRMCLLSSWKSEEAERAGLGGLVREGSWELRSEGAKGLQRKGDEGGLAQPGDQRGDNWPRGRCGPAGLDQTLGDLVSSPRSALSQLSEPEQVTPSSVA